MAAKKKSLESRKKQQAAKQTEKKESQWGFVTPRFLVVALIFVVVALAAVSCNVNLNDFIVQKNMSGYNLSAINAPSNTSIEPGACYVGYACAGNATDIVTAGDPATPIYQPAAATDGFPGNTNDSIGTGTINATANNSSESNASLNGSAAGAGIASSGASRLSQVEFYLLVKDKGYLHHILAEQQVGTYNFSGQIVKVWPTIITGTHVMFRIDDYTSKALAEGQSDAQGDFEIFVAAIYYRP